MAGISDGLVVVLEDGVGEHLDAGASSASVVVALSTNAVVGQDGAEVGVWVSPAVVIGRASAGICGTLVVIAAEVVTNL